MHVWSGTDMPGTSTDVCFTPESGHRSAHRRRPLCAKKADMRYVLFDLAIRSEPKCDGVPRVLQLGARPLTAFANSS
jgi:hypothetical protein